MSPRCRSPLSDEALLDYWIGAIPSGDGERVEEHLFACDDCSTRLEAMSTLGAGLAALVRRGRVAGALPRVLLNRIQRDGVQVRFFSAAPGERIPCAAFPGDDLMVLALRADFSRAESVNVALTDADDVVVGESADVPIRRGEFEILWATPGDVVRRMPSSRMRVIVSSSAPGSEVLAEYELDHTATPAP
jgi:hypothetical protein